MTLCGLFMFALHRGFGLRPKSAAGVPPACGVKRKYPDSFFFIFALLLCYFRFVPARGTLRPEAKATERPKKRKKKKRAGRPALLFGLEAEATSTPHPRRRRS
jgi:hypothetical protein